MDLMKMKDHEKYLTNHVVYSRHYAEFYDKFKRIKAEQTLSIDEAITLAYKRLWSAEEQVSFNQYLTTAREQRKAVMFLMPHFADFDAYFRHHRLKLWIEVVKRGYAVVFIKDNIAGLADPWHLKENVYTFRKVLGMKKIGDRTLEDELHAYRRYINYLCEFKFDALPEDVEAFYKKAKADAREHYAQQDNSKTQ